MKIPLDLAPGKRSHRLVGRRRRGFTLPEMTVAIAIVLTVTTAVLTCQVFGMKVLNITETKLGASQLAGKTWDVLLGDVRPAKTVRIGSGTATTFSEVAVGSLQQGVALQINTSTNTNYFVRYYLDSTTRNLNRITNGSSTPSIVARFITNQIPFYLEDYAGNIVTTRQNNAVLRLTLQFYQLDFPSASVGTGGVYDSLKVEARIMRRAAD
jgi:prepilin-type N-terminal cleavage/methylation domain-containing protein